MRKYPQAFIQFACSAGDVVNDDVFIDHLLKNVDRENLSIADLFRDIRTDVHRQRRWQKKPFFMDGLTNSSLICLNPKATEFGEK